ncbi:MAG TPA: hypothetical protein VJB87_04835 [Candidatus Nanoarchaeia archaeon]|nr:hypothetical protein [Candidatus Nanoarchaeia archaeon]
MVTQKKKILKTIIAYTLIAAITIVITATIYYSTYETIIIPYDYRIADYIGFNADNDQLHFGAGLPGTILERAIKITPQEETYISIFTDEDYVYPEENNIILVPNITKEITIYLHIPPKKIGAYQGHITVRQKKVKS